MAEVPAVVWRYLREVLTACTQLLNALCGGSAKETASSSAWRLEQAGSRVGRALRPAIDAVFRALPFVRQDDHCRKAHARDRVPFQ